MTCVKNENEKISPTCSCSNGEAANLKKYNSFILAYFRHILLVWNVVERRKYVLVNKNIRLMKINVVFIKMIFFLGLVKVENA